MAFSGRFREDREDREDLEDREDKKMDQERKKRKTYLVIFLSGYLVIVSVGKVQSACKVRAACVQSACSLHAKCCGLLGVFCLCICFLFLYSFKVGFDVPGSWLAGTT